MFLHWRFCSDGACVFILDVWSGVFSLLLLPRLFLHGVFSGVFDRLALAFCFDGTCVFCFSVFALVSLVRCFPLLFQSMVFLACVFVWAFFSGVFPMVFLLV